MTKENFEKALEFLFPSEGGYVNNKKTEVDLQIWELPKRL